MDNTNNNFIITCPNCNESVLIEKLNCGIFRHGIMKKNQVIINQHLDKASCEFLVKNELIYGCGKPFQIIIKDGIPIITICDYI